MRGSRIVLVYLAEHTIEEEKTLFRNIGSTVADGLNCGSLFVGVGKTTSSWQDFKESYSQALTALEIGRSLFPSGTVARYEDPRIYRITCQVKNKKVLRGFLEKTVLPLFEYDSRHKGVLCRTLGVFLENGNLRERADKLIIHRRTLDYRLRKISEVVRRDLNSGVRNILCKVHCRG
ncbi:MAG: helix-turn-helix domain-containing protein [Thermovirgaceae bacterium]|nr:helix-turn-helix domain-containing protein [Thermovirgaceae bacterium]